MRDGFVAIGNTRRFCNHTTKVITSIFRDDVAREIVASRTITALDALPPVKRGQLNIDSRQRRGGLFEIEDDIVGALGRSRHLGRGILDPASQMLVSADSTACLCLG